MIELVTVRTADYWISGARTVGDKHDQKKILRQATQAALQVPRLVPGAVIIPYSILSDCRTMMAEAMLSIMVNND